MKDTLRILVSWKCNLGCKYCCNENPRFRSQFTPTPFAAIDWHGYQNFCVTGGEPLLHMDTVRAVLDRIPNGKTIIFYTNGTLLTNELARELSQSRVRYMNVGLHNPADFHKVIYRVLESVAGTTIQARFHAQDIYADSLKAEFPHVSFKFWTMNDCDRDNEDRIVLSA